jgi:DNA modification methylase
LGPPEYFRPNTIYCGDCKEVLRKFPNECVDLIYADPPFFSNRHYEVIWGDGFELRAFEDRWKGGINNYIAWMVERLAECYRVLKPTGSMYLHCDSHASHYLKVEMDRFFGETNFINEIAWKRGVAHSDRKQGAQHYGRLHDNVLFYVKSQNYTWNQQYTPYDKDYVDNFYKHVEAGTGRRFQLDNLTAAKPGGDTLYEWHGKKPYKGRYWAYSKTKMEKFDKEGRLVYTKSGMPRYKRYLDEMPGVPLQDFWSDISSAGIGKEALGYPTQKPETLLVRIVKTSSNPTDIVLDPFAGCGTATAVAQKLSRRWIAIDVSPTSCKLMEKRMRSLGAQSFSLLGMPMVEDDLRKLPPFEFQNWVVQRLFGRVSSRKTADMGIDGYTFEGHPIQVKQSDEIGRNVVDNFETAMRRRNVKNGVIVAFSFGKGAYEEVARAKLHDDLDVRLVPVKELVESSRTNQPQKEQRKLE